MSRLSTTRRALPWLRSYNFVYGMLYEVITRSCLTLFREAAEAEADRALFQDGLDAFYGGAADDATLARLRL